MAKNERTFSLQELRSYNGENGRPIYIAYKGKVIDVTASKMWRGGMHMKLHPAGLDLTEEMGKAPHDVDVLDRYPQVGVLEEERVPRAAVSPGIPASLDRFLTRHPFFLRHPHPMTVHFPIAFMICTPLFTLLYLLTGVQGFETTALNCLGGGLLFCLVVIPTGLFTWWVYYQTRPMRAVTVKIVVSLVMFADGLTAFIWRLSDPTVTRQVAGINLLYLLLVFLLLPMVVVVAWFGATLTFPLRREKAAERQAGRDRAAAAAARSAGGDGKENPQQAAPIHPIGGGPAESRQGEQENDLPDLDGGAKHVTGASTDPFPRQAPEERQDGGRGKGGNGQQGERNQDRNEGERQGRAGDG